MTADTATTAIVTGAGQGFGRALSAALARAGRTVVACGRDPARLRSAVAGLPGAVALPGDVTDPGFRAELVAAAGDRLDLLVHNAGELGPSPLPPLAHYPPDALRAVLETTLLAPLALTQLALPALRANRGAVVALSSDAAVEAYPGWGGYGSAKAALDQLTAVLGVEEPDLRVYAFDPGDMRTAMHQRAFPGEDISDRPEPESVVPALLRLLADRPGSGRYRAADLLADLADLADLAVLPDLSAGEPA
jgi:NAD(P)-dependent dehydrogenase (short-subunit alcohol dehydrogenase family)